MIVWVRVNSRPKAGANAKSSLHAHRKPMIIRSLLGE